MPPAARVGDMHICPMIDPGPKPHVGGPILPPGEPTVLIGFMPAARVTDKATCVGPPDPIAKGSATVLIGKQLAARVGDLTSHGGAITVGCPTVLIGDAGFGGAGGGGGGSEEGAGAGSVAGAEATDASAQIGALQAAAAAGMAFVQQCTKYTAPPPPKASLKPLEKSKPDPKSKAKKKTPGTGPGGAAAESPEEAMEPQDDGADGVGAGTQQPAPGEATKTAWIGIELMNEQGEPIPEETYELMLPNGEVRTDKLSRDGKARIENIDPGTCQIRFPKLRERVRPS